MSGNKLTNILYDWKADMFSGDYYRMIHSDVDELKNFFLLLKLNLNTNYIPFKN